MSPQHRVLEFREYLAVPGREDALHARFIDDTFPLFERHGFAVLAFGQDRTDERHFLYVLGWSDEVAMQRGWEAFRVDPDWMSVRLRTEASGPIVESILSRPCSGVFPAAA
jgi:hypothetical protein